MARAEYQGCPPGVVRGAAAHPSIASALNHTVRLPRRRRPASYAGQLVTSCVRLGTWWRRSWFSLKGKAGTPGSGQGQPPTPGRPRAPSSGSVHQGGDRAELGYDRTEFAGGHASGSVPFLTAPVRWAEATVMAALSVGHGTSTVRL